MSPSTESSSIDWEYAPAPESEAIGRVKDRYLPFIDGKFIEGGGDDLVTVNPGRDEPLSTVSTVDEVLSRALAGPLTPIDWPEEDEAAATPITVDDTDADAVITH